MLDTAEKTVIILFIIIYAEMRKRAEPLTQRENCYGARFFQKAAWADSEHLRQTATYRLR